MPSIHRFMSLLLLVRFTVSISSIRARKILEAISEHVSYARSKFEIVNSLLKMRLERNIGFPASRSNSGGCWCVLYQAYPWHGWIHHARRVRSYLQILDWEYQDGSSIIYSPHCRDDLGMAVANSLAVKNGARRVEGLSMVLGSELGMLLCAIAVALNIRQDYYQGRDKYCPNETINTSEMVSRSGIPVPKQGCRWW